MNELLSLAELAKIMQDCAGGDELVLRDDAVDADFADLGYDSVALMETASQIQLRYGVRIDEDQLGQATTPRLLLELANSCIAGKAGGP